MSTTDRRPVRPRHMFFEPRPGFLSLSDFLVVADDIWPIALGPRILRRGRSQEARRVTQFREIGQGAGLLHAATLCVLQAHEAWGP
jgi:hypothetical protein